MDEFLFVFCTEYFIVRRVHIKELDLKTFRCRAEACGEEWQMGRHPQGTEIKAITYSNMQILYTKSDNDDSDGDQSRFDIYVIVDI
jgi:SHS2 domain-containing protein